MNQNFRCLIFCFLVAIKCIPAIAENPKNISEDKTNITLHEGDGLNSFIDRLFKKFVSSENEKKSLLPSESNMEHDAITSEDLKKFSNSSERSVQIDASEIGIGGKFRILDKIYGTTDDLIIFIEEEKRYKSISIYLKSCFFKPKLITDSIALTAISDLNLGEGGYNGWLSSKQSHLTSFENYRYRFWLLSCIISNHE